MRSVSCDHTKWKMQIVWCNMSYYIRFLDHTIVLKNNKYFALLYFTPNAPKYKQRVF
jgi:hypothetical protein